jgi:fucose permease
MYLLIGFVVGASWGHILDQLGYKFNLVNGFAALAVGLPLIAVSMYTAFHIEYVLQNLGSK